MKTSSRSAITFPGSTALPLEGPAVQQLMLSKGAALPLCHLDRSAAWRDLRFSGPFLEMFFNIESLAAVSFPTERKVFLSCHDSNM
jgi:hypothetical protein